MEVQEQAWAHLTTRMRTSLKLIWVQQIIAVTGWKPSCRSPLVQSLNSSSNSNRQWLSQSRQHQRICSGWGSEKVLPKAESILGWLDNSRSIASQTMLKTTTLPNRFISGLPNRFIWSACKGSTDMVRSQQCWRSCCLKKRGMEQLDAREALGTTKIWRGSSRPRSLIWLKIGSRRNKTISTVSYPLISRLCRVGDARVSKYQIISR